jgi:hypothetical protein
MLVWHFQFYVITRREMLAHFPFLLIYYALLLFIMAFVLAFVHMSVNINVIGAIDRIVKGCGKLQGIQSLPDRLIGKAPR